MSIEITETEGLSIFSPLFMDQGHVVGGNSDSQKVAQCLEQILGPRVTSISSIQITQSPLNKTESVQRDSRAHAVSNHLIERQPLFEDLACLVPASLALVDAGDVSQGVTALPTMSASFSCVSSLPDRGLS